MKIKRKVAVLVGAAVGLGLGVAVIAYWSQGGTGTGTATLTTTTGITVLQTSTVTGLYPGGTASLLSGTFTNLNTSQVSVSGVTATVQAFTSRTDLTKPACTQADFAIGGTAAGSVVPSGTAVGAWTGLTVSMINGALNQDNCKGQSITILYTANP